MKWKWEPNSNSKWDVEWMVITFHKNKIINNYFNVFILETFQSKCILDKQLNT